MDSIVTDKTILSSSTPSETVVVPISTEIDSLGNESTGISFISILKYILIILILGLLGYNLFAYLGGKKHMGKHKIFNTSHSSNNKKHKQEDIGDITSNAKNSGVNVLERSINSGKVSRNKIDDNSASVGRALSHAQKQKRGPLPDQAGSLTQNNRRSKSGFCYIGEDRGVRSCVKVNQSDMCMSGNIFPSHAICLNPNLRE
tara:strand:- start:16678 stop:17283 length:606 start_codon:yes stop_codon:yes gene_type:complete